MRLLKIIITGIAIFLVFTVILLFAGGYYIRTHYSRILKEQSRDQVALRTNSTYQFDFKDLHVNLFKRSLSIDSLTLTPDSLRLMESGKDAYKIHIKQLSITGINFYTFIKRKEYKAQNVFIKEPELIIIKNEHAKTDTSKEESKFDMYSFLESSDLVIHVNRLFLTSGKVSIIQNNLVNFSTGIHGKFNNIEIDKFSSHRSGKVLFADHSEINLNKLRIDKRDKFKVTKVSYLKYNSSSRELMITDLSDQYVFSHQEAARKIGIRKSLFSLRMKNIFADGISLQEIIDSNKLYARSIHVDAFTLHAFKDKRLPRGKRKKRPGLREAIERMEMNLIIDSIIAVNSDIYVHEITPENKELKVHLANLIVAAAHVTNDSLEKINHPLMTLRLDGYLQKQQKFYVNFNYPANSKNGAFNYNGKFFSANPAIFNTLAIAMASVKFTSGEINEITFDVNSNNYVARGELIILYKNLKIKVDKKDRGRIANWTMSKIGNKVMENSNPSEGKIIKGKVNYKRDPYKQVFAYWSKALIEAVPSALGVNINGKDADSKTQHTSRKKMKQQTRFRS